MCILCEVYKCPLENLTDKQIYQVVSELVVRGELEWVGMDDEGDPIVAKSGEDPDDATDVITAAIEIVERMHEGP